MVEIYNRDPSDLNYKKDIVEVSDPVEICLGQLKMLLLTNKGEVLGDPKFGLSLEEKIFVFDLSEQSLREEIQNSLNTYIPLFGQLGGSFNLKFFQGMERDIALLDFFIPNTGDSGPAVSIKVS